MDAFNSFFNGVSGINAMSHRLDVAANNVANVNTQGFKGSRSTFVDMLYTQQGNLALGHGTRLGDVGTSFASGSLENTGQATDMAISGPGFFQLRDKGSDTAGLYTRNGQFKLVEHAGAEANAYNLITPVGHYVQGYTLSADTVSPEVIGDILVKSSTPQTATQQVDVVVNLENNADLVEEIDTPLFASWDGTDSAAPLAENSYEYKTSLKIFGADLGDSGLSAPTVSEAITVYFDSTANPNEKEFLVACDPAADQRLIGGTTRYGADDRGAGALLYGVMRFAENGALNNVACWRVPPDGSLDPSPANQLQLGRGESYFSFDYNFSGTGDNSSAKINFGYTPKPQSLTSPGVAYADEAAATTIDATSSWAAVYDLQGNRVRAGDVITVQGTSGDGTPQTYSYTVDTGETLAEMLGGLESRFACTAGIVGGRLTLTDNEVGTSQLAITSISYQSASGLSPAADPALAQIFGGQGAAFAVEPENRFVAGTLATTSYANPSTTLFSHQDGYGKGLLQGLRVTPQGTIYGKYSNGQEIAQAQLVLATFTSLQGLRAEGGTTFSATDESGEAILGTADQGRFGVVTNNTLEMSNVDLGREMADLIFTQRAFQANSKSITTSDQIYETLLQLIRR